MVNKFKKGAASFYIVAFSTLILVVLATSFAMIIASEVTRTANDDLSQSAYDSALAGTEDAKVAFANYRRCVEAGKLASTNKPFGFGKVTCDDIMYWMQNPDCYMVGHILGKIPKDEEYEVAVGGEIVTKGQTQTTTNQAYTCVTISRDLPDYRGTLNKEKTVRTFRIMVGGKDQLTNDISKVRITWTSKALNNLFVASGDRVTFPQYDSGIKSPPMLEVKLVQTGKKFNMSQFDMVENGRTNRATLYLVPVASGGTNEISSVEVAKTNDRTVSHKAFRINCSGNECTADINLPEPVGGGSRNNNTFAISLSLPYRRPDTSFTVAVYCGSDKCGDVKDNNGENTRQEKIYNTQVSIDSTGRANDLYRRVETRLETEDVDFGPQYPYYALQVKDGINKDMRVEKEIPFYF